MRPQEQPNAEPAPPHICEVNVLSLDDQLTKEKGKEKVQKMDIMPLKRAKVVDPMESQPMMEEEAGTSKDKKRKKRSGYTRRRIRIGDFPLGVGLTPYNLIEDICAQGPKITWPQLLHMVPKSRRQWSSMVSTRKSSKRVGLIKAQDIEDIQPLVEAKIKGHSISKAYVDGGAQMCVMSEKNHASVRFGGQEPLQHQGKDGKQHVN